MFSKSWGVLSLIWFLQFPAQAQGLLLDASVGRSLADHAFGQVALRWQANPAFRIGVEAQAGYFKDRFIAARPVHDGLSWSVQLPLSLRFLETDRLRADVYLRTGFRMNHAPEAVSEQFGASSQAVQATPGVLVSLKASPRLWLQSGLLIPFTYEFAPDQIMEQVQSYQMLAGVSYRLSDRMVLFAQSPFGPSYGGDGDTAKFLWATSLGLRMNLGASHPSHLLLDPAQ